MQISKAPAPATPVRPPAAAPPAEAPAPAPADQVQLTDNQQKAMAMMQDAVQARQLVGGQFVQEVLAPAPDEVKAVLQQTAPHIEEVANELGKQGLATDQAFVLATETQKLVQAGINAEARAERLEGQHQSADRTALLSEELAFQNQSNVLINAFPEQAAQVAQMPAKADQISAGPFVDGMFKLISPEQVGQVKEAANHSPVALAALEHPELLQSMADSLAKTGAQLTSAAQGAAGYFQVIGKVIEEEMQAQQLLQPPQA